MTYISELSGILSHQLNWHKSRLDCFAQMLLALFMVRSVNLSEIAVAMNGDKASIDSRVNDGNDLVLDGLRCIRV